MDYVPFDFYAFRSRCHELSEIICFMIDKYRRKQTGFSQSIDARSIHRQVTQLHFFAAVFNHHEHLELNICICLLIA